MRVVYLVGMGRSGSTLLDLLLDAHSNVHSLGGVRRMLNALDGVPCPCGAKSHRECDFWAGLDERLRERIGVPLDELQPNSSDAATFRRHNTALFEAAAEIAGTDVVVDSSKSVSRLQRLLDETELDIHPVHIMRDPCGYAYSQNKRKRVRVTPAWSYVGRSLRVYALLRDREHSAIDYNTLARHTERTLRELMPRLGLAFEERQMRWAEQIHHNVGGGAVLKKTDGNAIRLDEAWREQLDPVTRQLIRLVAWPGTLANRRKARHWGLG